MPGSSRSRRFSSPRPVRLPSFPPPSSFLPGYPPCACARPAPSRPGTVPRTPRRRTAFPGVSFFFFSSSYQPSRSGPLGNNLKSADTPGAVPGGKPCGFFFFFFSPPSLFSRPSPRMRGQQYQYRSVPVQALAHASFFFHVRPVILEQVSGLSGEAAVNQGPFSSFFRYDGTSRTAPTVGGVSSFFFFFPLLFSSGQ